MAPLIWTRSSQSSTRERSVSRGLCMLASQCTTNDTLVRGTDEFAVLRALLHTGPSPECRTTPRPGVAGDISLTSIVETSPNARQPLESVSSGIK